jgi:hypothetical protein
MQLMLKLCNGKHNLFLFSNKERPLFNNFRWFFIDLRELRMRRLPKLVRKLLKSGRTLVENYFSQQASVLSMIRNGNQCG